MKRGSESEERAWRESVEFLTGDTPARDVPTDGSRSSAPSSPGRRWYRILVFGVVGGAMLAGLFDVLAHNHSGGARSGLASVGASGVHHLPSSVPPPQLSTRRCLGVDCPDGYIPEEAVITAFAADLPGAVVSSEYTVTGPRSGGGLTLVSRNLRVVFGNVDMIVTITPADEPEPSTPPHAKVQRLTHSGYDFLISITGIYPPTHRQLQILVADPRMTSIQS